MSSKLNIFTIVIWLMFLSLVHSLEKTMISDEMKIELRNCSFPLDDVGESEGLMALCILPKPNLEKSEDVKFTFAKYLCMELFDVSLQLCNPKFANRISKISDLKQSFPLPNPNEFCKKLIFFERNAEKTGDWARVAILNLKIPAKCEESCFSNQELNPLCDAIYLGNQLLIAVNPKPLQVAVPKVENEPAGPIVRQPPNLAMEIKKPSLDSDHPIPKESETGKAEDALGKTSNEKKINLDRKTVEEIKTKELSLENNQKQEKVLGSQLDDVHGVNEASTSEQHSGPKANIPLHEKVSTDSVTSLPVPPVHSAISPSVTESHLKGIANAPTDDQDEVSSDTFSSRGKVDVAGNDWMNPIPHYDGADVESKGTNAEDSISSSVPQEDHYDGEQEEIPPNLHNSIVLPYDNKVYQDRLVDARESHFFAYFITMVVICIIGYLVFHNKQKIIALALEGRRMQGSRRRPNTSSYKKLDSNLEEAVTSSCSSSSVTHVIF